MNPVRIRAYIYLLIAIAIWGVAASVIKFGLDIIPPFMFLTYRYFITTIVLLPFFVLQKDKGITKNNFWFVVLIALLGSTINHGLLFYGTKLSTSIDSSLITATAPIFVIIAGVIFLKEKVTHKERVGIAITLMGTAVIILQSLFEKGVNAPHGTFGNILILICNIAFTAYLILSKEVLRNKVSALSLTFATFAVGFVTTLPLTLFEKMPKNISLSAHFSVFYMAILSGALAYFLYQRAQKTIEASEASVFQYLQPLATLPVATIWLGEKITLPMIIGSALIGLGVFTAEWKRNRKKD